MDISKLKVGMELKNYPALCKMLGIPEKTRHSKDAQLKELKRFVDYKQKGHRFIIKEIYEMPIRKIENRGRRGKYIELVQLLLTDYLVEQKRQVVTITLNKALERLNLTNGNYSYCSSNIPRFSNYLGIEEQITYDHFMLTNSNFKRVLERALDNLSDMSLISVYKDAVFLTNTDNEVHLANDDEVELFKECGEITLNKILGNKNRSQRKMSNIRYSKYKRENNKLFIEKMREDKYGNREIKLAYIGYRIIVNRNAIKVAHDELLIEYLDDTKRKDKLDELETLVLSDLTEKVIKRQVDARDTKNKNINKRMREYRTMFSYVDDSKNIINIVHKQDAEDVKVKMEERRKRKITKKDNKAIHTALSVKK